ncbi:hypothetical protein OAP25_02225 [Flavobacteriaceae bacterium]|nr:hypothetical protein [Flavobacteriaceae bacterium]
MAIAYVGSATTDSAAASSMSVSLPTHSEDDYLVIAFTHNYSSSGQKLTGVGTGYTQLAEISESALGHQTAIWAKKAGASEADPTASYNSSAQIMSCVAFAFSGVDTTTALDVAVSAYATVDPAATVASPSLTTVTDGAMLVSVATADDNAAFTQDAAMTLGDSHQYLSMTTATAYETIPTLGATGTRTWTFAQSNDELTAISIALRPAIASGNTITATQTESGDTQSANLSNIIQVSGVQTESGDTQSATIESLAQINVSQAEVGDTQLASLSDVASTDISSSQPESGDSQSANLSNIIRISSSQPEDGDSQSASLTGVLTSLVTASQQEEGDTQGANLDNVISINSAQAEVGDTQSASVSNMVQLFASQTEIGDTQSVAFLTVPIELTAIQAEAGDVQLAAIAGPTAISRRMYMQDDRREMAAMGDQTEMAAMGDQRKMSVA